MQKSGGLFMLMAAERSGALGEAFIPMCLVRPTNNERGAAIEVSMLS